MRLTCPNCAAQYEVDERVIPASGRDVQCSNCGQTWFQAPAGAEIAAAPDVEAEADLPFEDAASGPLPEAPDDTGEPDDLQEGEDPAWPDVAADADLTGGPALSREAEAALAAALADVADGAPLSASADQPGTGADWAEEDWPTEGSSDDETTLTETAAPASQPEMPAAGLAAAGLAAAGLAAAAHASEAVPRRPEPELRRRSVDEAVLNVLREEAEREARARRGKSHGIETQSEMPLAPAAPRPEPPAETAPADATERGATLRGEDPELEAEIAAANRPPRRELLPDIEEINSTLRATSERGREAAAVDAPETLRRRRSGFRLGFGLSLGLALLLLGVYLGAPQLGARMPAVAPALNSYVASVDRGRIWLDRTLASKIEALSAAE